MKAATSYSDHIDSYTAGEEAATRLQDRIGERDLLLCFASVHHDQAALLQGVRSVLPDGLLLGGSSGATVTDEGWRKRSVALLGFKGEQVRLAAGRGRDSQVDAFAAGKQAAAEVLGQLGRPPQMLLVFPQAVVGCDHPQFLAGVQAVLPGVFIAGGASAMDGMLDPGHPLFLKSFQYWDTEVAEHTTPVVGLDWQPGAVVDAFAWNHGFMPIGMAATVSSVSGNVVHQIDGLPAIDYFKQYLGETFDFRVDAALLTLGLTEQYGPDVQATRVSPALQLNDDGSVVYIIPPAADQAVKLMRTTRSELVQGVRQAAEVLKERLGARQPSVIFQFSCGGRHALLGDHCAEEVEQVRAVFGEAVPIIGLQAGGEFIPMAPTRGQGADHPGLFGEWLNYSCCLYALAE